MTTEAWLDEAEWRERASRHRDRVEPWVAPRRERRLAGRTHPVDDFLFDYYPYSVAKLTAWHPGYGVSLVGDASAFLERDDYVRVDGAVTVRPIADKALARLRMVVRLLSSTAERAPHLACFGLHEWAMVHRIDEARHAGYPLRVSAEEVETVIDEVGLRCTHIDAYRFFTPSAIPLNAHEPTRAEQHDWEQPGCVHANMDLYKYAMWFTPHVPSELIADCFELARSARDLDMRAAPYDLSDLGYEPVPVETAEGRRQYVDEQRQIAAVAEGLRARLLSSLTSLDKNA